MAFKLDATSRKNMVGIHPDLVRVIERAAEIAPFPFRITEGLRTIERQRQLVKAGASKTLNSRHLTGHAFDAVPLVDLNNNGRFETNELYHWPLYYKLAPVIKQAAKELRVPIEWGGDWKSFKDGPHWQLPFKQYPKETVMSFVDTDPLYTGETENSARVKDSAAIIAAGGGGTLAAAVPAVSDVTEALSMQQGELTSGDWVRIGLAAAILALTIFVVWRRLKS